MKKLWLIIASCVILSGCATVTREQMQNEISNFSLPHKKEAKLATIYIVRPTSLGALIRFNVFVNDQQANSEMGWTRGSQHIYFQVAPGTYKIFSKAENWAETSLSVVAGESYFIRQDAQMGIIMARNSILPIDPVEGIYHVMKTGRGEFLKQTYGVENKLATNQVGSKK